MNLHRYSRITESANPREIVLLKALPCKWGKCSFCDYIHDNSNNEDEIAVVNREVLQQITGKFGVLQVINSGSCVEIPAGSLALLKAVVQQRGIKKLFFEAHWMYRHRLQEISAFFGVPIVFITGIETFDASFRNNVLNKGIEFSNIEEITQFFQSVCLMVGIKGQTREMIKNDIALLLANFSHGTINLFVNNSTAIKADLELQDWFKKEYAWLKNEKKVDILFENTDFGVGGKKQ